MIFSYFRSLYRNISRNKFYTILNFLGISLGFITTLFLLFYVQDELGYDKYNKNYKRIYRLESEFTVNNNSTSYANFPIPLGPTLLKEVPEIENMVRIDAMGVQLLEYEGLKYYEREFYLADSSMFQIFTHKFLYGNPETCLREPHSMVLTQSIAEKLFDRDNPLGKIISANGESYKITAVIEDLPGNTHMPFTGLVSISTEPEVYSSTKASHYWRLGAYTYILLNEHANIQAVYDKFDVYYKNNMEALGQKYGVSQRIMATPLAETHFRKGLSAEYPTGNKAYVFIFAAVALFVLLIGAINYMNMATARSANRAKEVGIRKVLGADKSQLIQQFLSESVFLAIAALIFSIGVVWLLFPEFNQLAGKSLGFISPKTAPILLYMSGIAVFIGLLSGSYPAFFLSSFQPITVLKGKMSSSGKGSGRLRKLLVLVQFFMALVMIISTLVVLSQMDYLHQKDLGFKNDDLLIAEIGDMGLLEKIPAIKEELLNSPNVLNASNSSGFPSHVMQRANMRIEGENGMGYQVITYFTVDYDFVKTYGLNLIEGRDFNKDMGTDALEAVLINETAAKAFGWEDHALGKHIHYGYKKDGSGGRMMKVVGVLKDFNFKSLHNKIEPIILFIGESPSVFFSVRYKPGTEKEVLSLMKQKWEKFGAASPLHTQYLNQWLDKMYTAEQKISQIISLSAIIAIFIVLLGLFGLSSFITEQKAKEIGIRKILGASLGSMLRMLYKDYIYLFLIAFILAIPIAWWQLQNWLESTFVYYQPLQWTQFLLAGFITLGISLATVSYFIIRVATGNPVDAIKWE